MIGMIRTLILVVVMTVAAGCGSSGRSGPPVSLPQTSADAQLLPETYIDIVQATVAPPIGWEPQPLKASTDHAHQLWISPSGHTAFGVIRFNLPFPVGHRWVLWGFMRQMRQDQGQAILLEDRWDPDSRLLRFVAEGGLYKIRTNLLVSGTTAWAIYAGTVRNVEVNQAELDLAERARERAWVGRATQSR